jgi:osmotically inducible protein OsmC
MKFSRKAKANWKGTGMEGKGTITTQSTILNKSPFSFTTRFADGIGTNPEELIGAAHAGCFTMQLSFLISETDHVPTNLDTKARVFFEDGSIVKIKLNLEGEVPGMSNDEFQALAQKAKEICPISKLLNTEIELKVELK